MYICIRIYYTLLLLQFSFLPLILMKIMQVVSPDRYWKNLMDVDNPGVLEVFLEQDQQCYSVLIARSSVADRQEGIFYWIVATFGVMAPPVLLRITWRKQLAVLEQLKVTKGGPAVMWACIAWMPIANVYFTAKFLAANSHFATNKKVQSENDRHISLVAVYFILFSTIAAVIQSGKPPPGLPKTRVLKSALL